MTKDWDLPDNVIVQFQIDGSGYNNLLAFESQNVSFNSEPLEDTDFDGTGDGTALTNTLAQFTKSISATGSTLDIRITIALNSEDEDIAFDNIQISGSLAAVPEPTTTGLLAAIVGGTIAFRCKRKKYVARNSHPQQYG